MGEIGTGVISPDMQDSQLWYAIRVRFLKGQPMSVLLNNVATVVAILVFFVLVAGLLNLLRTNSSNMSQKLMRWRVGLQFIAIILIVTSAWIAKHI